MYRCDNCGAKFYSPEIRYERHGLDRPPYERVECCPECGVSGMIDFEREDEQDEFNGISERSA